MDGQTTPCQSSEPAVVFDTDVLKYLSSLSEP